VITMITLRMSKLLERLYNFILDSAGDGYQLFPGIAY
jgi:hypothetical protein